MTVSRSNVSFTLILALIIVQGGLEPNGMVSLDCGSEKTFVCRSNPRYKPLGWNITGLSGISIPGPFMARTAAMKNDRITSTDTGGDSQKDISIITISGFFLSDNGGTIKCINTKNSKVQGRASISVGLRAPTDVLANTESCDTVTLKWTQPNGPEDITTSVSCTPSPDCTTCTTSPCTIIGLNPSTEYLFTVTLNSVMCGTSMSTTETRTRDLHAPTNVVATARSCGTVTLQWTQPSEPNDITTSVSCTPPSPSCAECITSPCNITGLNPSTEYVFTVTLRSGKCGTNMSRTGVRTSDDGSCVIFNSTGTVGNSSASLAALVILVLLLIPLIYPLGVLIAKYCCFRDKSYCEVFWCCGCCRKDKSPGCHSTELTTSPHPREEGEYQNINKEKHIQFVTDGEENKDQRANKQEHVVTYETVEQLGDDDEDIITDETVEKQGNEEGITYATLDFSGHRKGNINVVHSITDEVTYAAV